MRRALINTTNTYISSAVLKWGVAEVFCVRVSVQICICFSGGNKFPVNGWGKAMIQKRFQWTYGCNLFPIGNESGELHNLGLFKVIVDFKARLEYVDNLIEGLLVKYRCGRQNHRI